MTKQQQFSFMDQPTATKHTEKPTLYIERDGKPIPSSLPEWLAWRTAEKKRVAQTVVGNVLVSTVFLGIDYGYNEDVPVLYETMLFANNGKYEPIGVVGNNRYYQRRYVTREAALAGHDVACRICRKFLKDASDV